MITGAIGPDVIRRKPKATVARHAICLESTGAIYAGAPSNRVCLSKTNTIEPPHFVLDLATETLLAISIATITTATDPR